MQVADRLHMKVYWSQHRGCVIGSANLSYNALGKSGLKEAGIHLPPEVVDIDKVLSAAKPRRLTKADMNLLARQERRAASKGFKLQPKTAPASFLEWYEGLREDSWKVAWWEGHGSDFAEAAIDRAQQDYDVEPSELMPCAEDQIAEYDWLLCVEVVGEKITAHMSWMFVDFVVPVKSSERYAYEAS